MKPTCCFYLISLVLLLGCWDLSLSERPGNSSRDSDDSAATMTASDEPHPCDGMVCDTPPAGLCENAANMIRRFAASGYCEVEDGKPVCRYPTFMDMCLTGQCVDGRCPQALAQGTNCHSADPVCDGKHLVTRDTSSAVVNSSTVACVYTEQRIECDEGCRDSRCVNEPCLGISCHRPPARYCHDNNLITFSPVGICDDSGICQYKKKLTVCSEDCIDGACVESDACRFLTCRTPPANFCVDDQILYRYQDRGFCADGACIYSGETIECQCSDGVCQNDPCLSVRCLRPPPMQCNQKGNLLVWSDDGAPLCHDGKCIYNQQELSCGDERCTDGECPDPCIGMDSYCNDLPLPPEYCVENSVISYKTATRCDTEGHCVWTEKEGACTDCDPQICEAN